MLFQFGEQVAQFPGFLAGRNGSVRHHGDAGGVISPVLQAAESLKDNVQRAVANIYPA